MAYPGPNIKFSNEVAAVRAEVRKLVAKGINKIIALGHSGIAMDILIAKSIPEIDIVIGGHTNTFLYNGRLIFSSSNTLFLLGSELEDSEKFYF